MIKRILNQWRRIERHIIIRSRSRYVGRLLQNILCENRPFCNGIARGHWSYFSIIICSKRPCDLTCTPPILAPFKTLIPAWISNDMHYKLWDKLLIHSQTSMVQPLKFGMGKEFHPTFLLGMWLLIHASIKVNPRWWRGPMCAPHKARVFVGALCDYAIRILVIYSNNKAHSFHTILSHGYIHISDLSHII